MSDKYPRTYHLPWSPGATDDDKVLDSVEPFLNRDLVITEKVDGGNCCLNREGVFARTHGAAAAHPSFDHIKSYWATIRYDIPEGMSIFGENAYAKHSIAYNELPAFFLVFGIRLDAEGYWLSWEDVGDYATGLGLKTIPALRWRVQAASEKDLKALGAECLKEGSRCGGEAIEGYVVRLADPFWNENFSKSVAKWVRKDHVQTQDHWMLQAVTPNKLRV